MQIWESSALLALGTYNSFVSNAITGSTVLSPQSVYADIFIYQCSAFQQASTSVIDMYNFKNQNAYILLSYLSFLAQKFQSSLATRMLLIQ